MKRSLLAGLGAVAFTATLGLAQTAPAEARSTGVSADAIASTRPPPTRATAAIGGTPSTAAAAIPTATATIAETAPARFRR